MSSLPGVSEKEKSFIDDFEASDLPFHVDLLDDHAPSATMRKNIFTTARHVLPG